MLSTTDLTTEQAYVTTFYSRKDALRASAVGRLAGLVFGRLDLRGGGHRHIGRIGIFDDSGPSRRRRAWSSTRSSWSTRTASWPSRRAARATSTWR